MTKTKEIVKFSFLLLFIFLFLIGAGGFFGYYFAVGVFRAKIAQNAQAETLGKLLNQEQKIAISQVYADPWKAAQEIDNYSWAVPTVISPFVGHGSEPGTHDNAKINSQQFRAEQELLLPKPHHTYRIFLIGGSTAFSSGAPSQERTIAAYLTQILKKKLTPSTNTNYEVFTMATPAWASTHERIIIENRLSEFEPDLVISLSGNNDVHWGAQGRNVLWFRSYADEFYWDMINAVYSRVGLDKMPDVVQVQTAQIPPSIVAERLEKNIKLSSYALFLKQTPYLFCLQPTLAATKKVLTEREALIPSNWREYFRDCYKEIDAHLAHLQIDNFTYCNLAEIFDDKNADEELFIDNYHFGDKGNAIIAERVYDCAKGIIASSPSNATSKAAAQQELKQRE
jgi:lysophospholipase L1-like esterase